MSKKKKAAKYIKPIIIGSFAAILLLVVLITAIGNAIDGAISMLGGDDTSSGVTASIQHTIMRSLDRFKISGTKEDDKYLLTFSFTEWDYEMTDIVLEDTEAQQEITVKLPAIAGSREEMAYSFLIRKGFTSAAACGVMGNIYNQTDGTFSASSYKVLNGTYGIFGWRDNTSVFDVEGTHTRKSDLTDYIQANGLDKNENTDALYLLQLDYALKENGYSDVLSSIKYMEDTSEAAKSFCKDYIKAVVWSISGNEAAEKAREYYTVYKGQRGYKNHGVYDDVTLKITLVKDGDKVYFDGFLDGINIGGNFKDEESIVGRGTFGEGAYSKASSMLNPYGEDTFSITSLAMVDRLDPKNAENGVVVHYGWDFYAYHKAPIYAVYDGVVEFAGAGGDFGEHYVLLKCGDLYVHYGHMDSHTVQTGDVVVAGQQVGIQGASGYVTGSHLHLEFRRLSRWGEGTANLEDIEDILIEYCTNYNTMKPYFSEIIR